MDTVNLAFEILVLFFISLHSSIAQKPEPDCEIYNLPTKPTKKGDVYILKYPEETSVSLKLECRCKVLTPKWQMYKMNSFESKTIRHSEAPVKCMKDGKSCSDHFIRKKSPGYYLYQTYTFEINEPTVLMCSSTKKREVVLVSVKQETPEPIKSTPCTSTTAESSTVPVSSPEAKLSSAGNSKDSPSSITS